MRIERRRLDSMTPAEYNPRRRLQPGDREWETLKASIDTFGLVEPIILNDRTGNIVGGHQRYFVLLDSGAEETDCVILDLPPDDEKILNIALNKIAGRWDTEKLVEVLEELQTAGAMEPTGFAPWELDALKATYDHIDDLLEEDFTGGGTTESTTFTMTFTFPEEFREDYETWLDTHDKRELAALITEQAVV